MHASRDPCSRLSAKNITPATTSTMAVSTPIAMPTLPNPQGDITALLEQWSSGQSAAGEIVPILYKELRRIAAARLRAERTGHTLQPTALVNDLYLKLASSAPQQWQNRAHFLTFASHVMRQLLADHARKFRSQKRGMGGQKCELKENSGAVPSHSPDALALDEALSELAKYDERKAKLIELKYFGGLSGEELAETLEMSSATVTREVRRAEAWLKNFLSGAPAQ